MGLSLIGWHLAWINEALEGGIPEERRADCTNCAMCTTEAQNSFHPDTRCCTFYPELPNFVLGAILGSSDPLLAEGQAVIRDLLTVEAHVKPEGLMRPPAYTAAFKEMMDRRAFGQTPALRCPFYQSPTGQCGIWLHREARCSTWFCKHDRGAVGFRFWTAVYRLFLTAEHALRSWCVRKLDAVDWGQWAGREEAFYRACAEQVHALAWSDIRQIGGEELAKRQFDARSALSRLNATEIPVAVQPGHIHLHVLGEDQVRVSTYSPFDPVEIPRVLWDALPKIHGDPRRIVGSGDLDLQLSDDLIRRLMDFELLVSKDP